MATDQSSAVNWDWANDRLTLPIYAAVTLSLGYEINTLAPVGQRWKNRPFNEPPEDYTTRVAATYEAVRCGVLRSVTTSLKRKEFDLNADFEDAQFWEISTVEFRRFCDARSWQTPEQEGVQDFV